MAWSAAEAQERAVISVGRRGRTTARHSPMAFWRQRVGQQFEIAQIADLQLRIQPQHARCEINAQSPRQRGQIDASEQPLFRCRWRVRGAHGDATGRWRRQQAANDLPAGDRRQGRQAAIGRQRQPAKVHQQRASAVRLEDAIDAHADGVAAALVVEQQVGRFGELAATFDPGQIGSGFPGLPGQRLRRRVAGRCDCWSSSACFPRAGSLPTASEAKPAISTTRTARARASTSPLRIRNCR